MEEEAAPRQRWTKRTVRPAAPTVEDGAQSSVSDLRRGIVDKAYHFIGVKHQALDEDLIGSGTVNDGEGPAVVGKSAIIFPCTAAEVEYVYVATTAALPPWRKGAESGVFAPPRAQAPTRTAAQAATTDMNREATASEAADLREEMAASQGIRGQTGRALPGTWLRYPSSARATLARVPPRRGGGERVTVLPLVPPFDQTSAAEALPRHAAAPRRSPVPPHHLRVTPCIAARLNLGGQQGGQRRPTTSAKATAIAQWDQPLFVMTWARRRR